MAALKKHISGFGLSLLLAACAADGGDKWPSVSFGEDIEAIEAAIAEPTEASLAPLPALSEEQKRGAENPAAYFEGVQEEFFDIKLRLTDRRTDYASARDAFSASAAGSRADWLAAQMELSNISQYTEALKTVRAKLVYIGEAAGPRVADFLKAAEELELSYRTFIASERSYLAETRP